MCFWTLLKQFSFLSWCATVLQGWGICCGLGINMEGYFSNNPIIWAPKEGQNFLQVPNDPITSFFFFDPLTSYDPYFCWIGVRESSKEESSYQEKQQYSSWIISRNCCLVTSSCSQQWINMLKRDYGLARVINSDYQDQTGVFLYTTGKRKYLWNQGAPLGSLLMLLCPVVKVNGN